MMSLIVKSPHLLALCVTLVFIVSPGRVLAEANPLEQYVQQADTTFSWKRTEHKRLAHATAYHLELISQSWRGQFWSHHLQVVRPDTVRNPGLAFLFITGDSAADRDLRMLETVAERAGAIAAVVTKVPNQPLYDGRTEDSLIAYTLDQYLRSGDQTWPLLFPMVKSAVRAMDVVQSFAREEFQQKVDGFVVSGASKRGWTTWLTGAADPRVKAIAPMVIDMLNMKVQLRWAEKVYGQQSEQIHDYTELHLHQKLDDPPMQKLRSWIDPYSFKDRYTMPKLLLLGTNDPYWTVDSLHNYWDDLPEPKLVFQTPNAGHDLAGGKDAVQTLAAWFQMIADHQPLPKVDWQIHLDGSSGTLNVHVDQPASHIRLWTADSADRDFRDDKWSSRELEIQPGSSQASSTIEKPDRGYRAFLAEVQLTSPTGQPYKLSTEARVIPDDIR
jgi:PhoPQ-activated pathogenicity-related protein